MYSHSGVRKSVPTSVRTELAELSEAHAMDFDQPKEITEHISRYSASIPPAPSKALKGYMQTKKAFCLALLSTTISLISFSMLHFVQTSVKAVHHSSPTLLPQYTRPAFRHRYRAGCRWYASDNSVSSFRRRPIFSVNRNEIAKRVHTSKSYHLSHQRRIHRTTPPLPRCRSHLLNT